MTVDHNKINEFIMEIGACNLKIYAKDKIAQTKSKNTLKNLEIFSLCLKAIHSQVRNIPTRLDTTWEWLISNFFPLKTQIFGKVFSKFFKCVKLTLMLFLNPNQFNIGCDTLKWGSFPMVIWLEMRI